MKQLFAIGIVVLSLPILAAIALGGAESTGDLPPDVHAIHLDAEVECETCHEAAWSAESVTGMMPDHDTCGDCHEVDDTDNCGLCHSAADAPSGPIGLGDRMHRLAGNFPHVRHLGEGDPPCAACHQLQESGAMGMPAHADCRGCHATTAGFQDCALCHGGVDPPRPKSHTAQYMALHALDASWDSQQCRSCHTQVDCQDCHNGDNVRPRVHELNFAYSHAMEARSSELLCTTCHAEPEFCSGCHAAERIYPSNHSRADWLTNRHGVEASYNLESCIACHDAGQDDPVCADCHGGR